MKVSWLEYHDLIVATMGRELVNQEDKSCTSCSGSGAQLRPADYPVKKIWPFLACPKCRELLFFRQLWDRDFGKKISEPPIPEHKDLYSPGINWRDGTYQTILTTDRKGKSVPLHTKNVPPTTIPPKQTPRPSETPESIQMAIKGASNGCIRSVIRVGKWLQNVHNIEELESYLMTLRGEAEEMIKCGSTL